LLRVDPLTGEWMEKIESFSTEALSVSESFNNQPVDFIMHNDIWYVLVKDSTMSYARLRRYSLQGEYIDHLPLPDTDMIMAIERFGNSIVLSDFRKKRLLRIGLEGEPLDDLSSEDLDNYLKQLGQSSSVNLGFGIALWGVFALLLLVGIVLAIRLESKAKQDKAKIEIEEDITLIDRETPRPTDDSEIRWITPSTKLGKALIVVLICAASLIGFGLYASGGEECGAAMVRTIYGIAVAALLLMLLPVVLMWSKLKKTKLGVVREWVVGRFPDGSVALSRAGDLRHIRNAILILENRKLMIGQPQNRFFEKSEFEKYVEPLLKRATPLSGLELLKWRWRHDRFAQIRDSVLTFGLLLVCYLYIFHGGEEVIDQWFAGEAETCEQQGEAVPQG
jgi:hypothetical protein